MKSNIPLVCNRVKLHVVFLLPLVHRAAELDLRVSRAAIVEAEDLWFFGVLNLIESAHHLINFVHVIWLHMAAAIIHIAPSRGRVLTLLICALVYVTEQLLSSLVSKDFFDDAHRLIHDWVPIGLDLHPGTVYSLLVEEVIVGQAAEF